MTINIATRIGHGIGRLKNVVVSRAFSAAALGVMGALAISVAAFTGTASASTADCPDPGMGVTDRVCMWKDINFGGGYFINNNPSPWTCYSVPEGYNDTISSMWNRTQYYLYYYDNGGCSGPLSSLQPGYTLSWVGSANNDRISSYRVGF